MTSINVKEGSHAPFSLKKTWSKSRVKSPKVEKIPYPSILDRWWTKLYFRHSFQTPPVSRKICPKPVSNLTPTPSPIFFGVWMSSLNLQLFKTQQNRKMREKISLLAHSIFLSLLTPMGHFPDSCQTYHALQQSGFGYWLHELAQRARLLFLSGLKEWTQEGKGHRLLLACPGEESPAVTPSPRVSLELSWSPYQHAEVRPGQKSPSLTVGKSFLQTRTTAFLSSG